MDKILESLQGKAFHLSDKIYNFLSGRYTNLLATKIPDLLVEHIHPDTIRQIITYHRKQFLTKEYMDNRLANPTTGTIDHLHAEITASTAVRLANNSGYSGYATELLRAAGHFHDADRSFPLRMIQGEEGVRHDAEAYSKYKKLHAINSAKRARELVQRAEGDNFFSSESFISDLEYLITRHELGGEKHNGINLKKNSEFDVNVNLNDLTDILTNSDSIAYFDANILTNWEECGKNPTLLGNKVHFMYDRMTAEAQKELRNSIIYSENHILGSPSTDVDINSIREILLSICC